MNLASSARIRSTRATSLTALIGRMLRVTHRAHMSERYYQRGLFLLYLTILSKFVCKVFLPVLGKAFLPFTIPCTLAKCDSMLLVVLSDLGTYLKHPGIIHTWLPVLLSVLNHFHTSERPSLSLSGMVAGNNSPLPCCPCASICRSLSLGCAMLTPYNTPSQCHCSERVPRQCTSKYPTLLH